jgi:lipopolysaccharide export system protein LptA
MNAIARLFVFTTLAGALACLPAAAQQRAPAKPQPAAGSGPANPVQGFSQNRGQPVHIESTRLEVRDKDKIATFIGNVQVNQGDTEMRCKTLVVHYEPDQAGAPEPKTQALKTDAGAPGGEQRIKRLEAFGNVVVTQKDQIATGDKAVFDMKSNTVTMIGNVVVTQGQSVMRGERLAVDMTTGFSRLESGKNGQGRVQGLFLPGAGGTNMPGSIGRPENSNASHPQPGRRGN